MREFSSTEPAETLGLLEQLGPLLLEGLLERGEGAALGGDPGPCGTLRATLHHTDDGREPEQDQQPGGGDDQQR